ncbi:hypothetical protein WB401_40905 [Streptomyces brasiliscabiei]|uniref:Uncharacterized protein n=1 Tax=Streptomyces brasiliscabiei TaxID=2736302 RepID=A0ABU8GS75_9ACTN
MAPTRRHHERLTPSLTRLAPRPDRPPVGLDPAVEAKALEL